MGAVAATADTTDILDLHSAALAARTEQLRRLEIDLVDRIATLELEAFNRTYRGRSAIVTGGILADIDRADSLVQGTEDDGWQKRSPDTAETILSTAQRELTSLLADVRSFQTEYSAQRERDYVASADPIIAHVASASLLESEINASTARVRQLLAQARTLQQTALTSERAADTALQEAKDQIAIAETVRDQDEVELSLIHI